MGSPSSVFLPSNTFPCPDIHVLAHSPMPSPPHQDLLRGEVEFRTPQHQFLEVEPPVRFAHPVLRTDTTCLHRLMLGESSQMKDWRPKLSRRCRRWSDHGRVIRSTPTHHSARKRFRVEIWGSAKTYRNQLDMSISVNCSGASYMSDVYTSLVVAAVEMPRTKAHQAARRTYDILFSSYFDPLPFLGTSP